MVSKMNMMARMAKLRAMRGQRKVSYAMPKKGLGKMSCGGKKKLPQGLRDYLEKKKKEKMSKGGMMRVGSKGMKKRQGGFLPALAALAAPALEGLGAVALPALESLGAAAYSAGASLLPAIGQAAVAAPVFIGAEKLLNRPSAPKQQNPSSVRQPFCSNYNADDRRKMLDNEGYGRKRKMSKKAAEKMMMMEKGMKSATKGGRKKKMPKQLLEHFKKMAKEKKGGLSSDNFLSGPLA